MFYSMATTVSAVIAILLVLIALRTLLKGTWFWGWVRGMSGFVLIGLAVFCVLVALDLRSYQQVLIDKPVATVSFQKVEDRAYVATVALTDTGETTDYYLRGDQWQIDARIIRWKGLLTQAGGKPGYRLERISGRYISIEDERSRERTVHALRNDKEYGLDLWAWAYKNQADAPLIDAVYGSATFVPMTDGALYEVALSHTGLVAKPLNETAKRAVNLWLD
jgi:hypothetical protein